MMLTKEDIRNKIDWEGWPTALEWLGDDEIEDPEIAGIIGEAMSIYIRLEQLYSHLDNLLSDDTE